MLQELMLRRAGALLLVVVALFSCLAPAFDARASEIRPDVSGFTTIPPPEIQSDMGPPMAPDPGGVTMVLPEAQEQEKGGTTPSGALSRFIAKSHGDAKEQYGPTATVRLEAGDLAALDDLTPESIRRDAKDYSAHDGPEPDSTWPVWINATCGGVPENLTLWIAGVGDIQTPYFTYWDDSQNLTINVTMGVQQRSSCGRCIFDQWSDGDPSHEKILNITAPTELVAWFHDEYSVMLDTIPTGLNLEWKGSTVITPIVTHERPGSYVAYAITPQGPYIFTNWSDESIVNPRTIVVTGPGCTNMTAIYNGLFRVRITANKPGIKVSYDGGAAQTAPMEFWAEPGSTHMLLTTSPQPPDAVDTRFRFDRWSGGPSTWGWNVTINAPQTYAANFITQYLIGILANIPGPILGSDIPGCDVPQPAPIYCWADEDSFPNLIIPMQGNRPCNYSFLSWADADTRRVKPIGPVTGPATYIAMFLSECTVTVQDTCTGRPPVTTWFALGEVLDLIWTPPSGLPPRERYRFIKWICDGPGCYSGTEQNPLLIIQGPINETAVCAHEFLVNVDTSPTGIPYNIDDANCNGLTSLWWANQSKHWLNLTTLSYRVGTVRYLFTHWSDGVTLTQRQVLIDAPEDFIAYYDRPQVKLTLLPPVIGGIRCVEHPDCWYNEFEMATAHVTSPWADGAGARYVFVQWSGDANGFDTSIQILMDAPKTLQADWAISYRLEVISSYGNPQCSIADCWYSSDAPATVTLEDPFITGTGSRQKFISWSIDASGSANPLTLTMDGPKTVSAAWKPQFLLTVVSECASISDCGSPTGAGWYDGGKDATASLTEMAVENGGMRCVFIEWSGDASGTGNLVTVAVDRPLALIVEWVVQFWLTVTSDCSGASECETPGGQGWYDNQSYASLTVNATFADSSGNIWDFIEWIGDASGKDLSVAVLMDSPKSVTAMWIERTPSNPNAPFDVFLIATASIIVTVILAAILLFAWRRRRIKDEYPNGKTMERNDAGQIVNDATSQPRIKGGA